MQFQMISDCQPGELIRLNHVTPGALAIVGEKRSRPATCAKASVYRTRGSNYRVGPHLDIRLRRDKTGAYTVAVSAAVKLAFQRRREPGWRCSILGLDGTSEGSNGCEHIPIAIASFVMPGA